MDILEEAIEAAKARGIDPVLVDCRVKAACAGPERIVRAMRDVFAIIACSDSAVHRAAMLREMAMLWNLREVDVVADWNSWVAKGGKPAC